MYLPLRNLTPVFHGGCLFGVCSDVAAPPDSAGHQAALEWAQSRTKRHRQALPGRSRTQSSGLFARQSGPSRSGLAGAPSETLPMASRSVTSADGRFNAVRFIATLPPDQADRSAKRRSPAFSPT
jgi:hypothetical protein